ncbi:hypothetical protein LFML04_0534 [Leptospirillum ferriphilum ML-04]|uniref:Uncharacterized protein n=1 Tax=Leptospirillum ferriphilum (strain ML-04) TaxID=1048260 RepID=J9Z9F0_LEPFM|nr:hypothetical protein LFML04_0534 [Leptospirillum ferriphilum ML-04]
MFPPLKTGMDRNPVYIRSHCFSIYPLPALINKKETTAKHL